MKIHSEITLSIIVVTLGFTAGHASEKAITMKDLPAAVQRTVQEQSKGAAILHRSLHSRRQILYGDCLFRGMASGET